MGGVVDGGFASRDTGLGHFGEAFSLAGVLGVNFKHIMLLSGVAIAGFKGLFCLRIRNLTYLHCSRGVF